ncbi:MAG: hypothetical protein Q4D45_04395 [Lachnospiraceae bacterium]|nr:hypothetical protein [Lachnospiraceae bacterium]
MKKALTIGETLFCCALFCEVIAMEISLTTIPYMVNTEVCNSYLKALRYLGYILIIFKMIYDKISLRELLSICIMILILGFNSIFSGRMLFMTFIFIYGMKGVKFEKIARIMLIWLVMSFFIIVIGSQSGVIDNWGYGLAEKRPRYAIGYFYPSHATSALFYLTILFCYVKKEKLKLWHVFLLEIINIWQYMQTNSRTGTALITIALITFYFSKFVKINMSKGIIGFCFKYSFPVCAILSVFCCIFYHKFSILGKINDFVTNRIALGHDGILNYGIHLHGQQIKWIGNGGLGYLTNQLNCSYNYVDCSYVKILLECGLIVWLIVICGFTVSSILAVQNNDKYMAVSLMFVAGYCIIEPRLIELGFNPFVLVLANLIGYTDCFMVSSRKTVNGE